MKGEKCLKRRPREWMPQKQFSNGFGARSAQLSVSLRMAPAVFRLFPRSLDVFVRNGSVHSSAFTYIFRWDARASSRVVGIRCKSTSASASIVQEGPDKFFASSANEEWDSRKDSLDLTFNDHEAAFKSKTTKELLRAILVFHLCSIKPLVENNEKVCLSFLPRFFAGRWCYWRISSPVLVVCCPSIMSHYNNTWLPYSKSWS